MEFSVPMALVDYIPVICFAVAAVMLIKMLHNKMSALAFSLFSAGCIDVACAGALKATYKLLYAANVCDFQPLNAMFFPVQSIGFLLAGLGILLMICKKSKGALLSAAAPAVYKGTFIFVGLMVAGLGVMDTVLCILCAKLKKKWLIAVFVFSFVCSLAMGYLSSQDFAQASMNWIAEIINVFGQGSLLFGVWKLKDAGLEELQLGVQE